jgi:hypothetical protein
MSILWLVRCFVLYMCYLWAKLCCWPRVCVTLRWNPIIMSTHVCEVEGVMVYLCDVSTVMFLFWCQIVNRFCNFATKFIGRKIETHARRVIMLATYIILGALDYFWSILMNNHVIVIEIKWTYIFHLSLLHILRLIFIPYFIPYCCYIECSSMSLTSFSARFGSVFGPSKPVT